MVKLAKQNCLLGHDAKPQNVRSYVRYVCPPPELAELAELEMIFFLNYDLNLYHLKSVYLKYVTFI